MKSGKQLADDRLISRVSQRMIAKQMQISQQGVSKIEQQTWVGKDVSDRYISALMQVIDQRKGAKNAVPIVRIFQQLKTA